MAAFNPGLVHTPVTPFKADQSIDYDTYRKLIEFHLRNGADGLALAMPAGEDLSLRDAERSALLEFAVKEVRGRVPVIAHVSEAGTDVAVARARAAERAGAAAIVSHPPYFWHPKAHMVVEHLVRIGKATGLPFFVCSPPVEDVGTPLTTEIVLEVQQKVKTLAGLVDANMDWVFMTEVVSIGRSVRPDFELLPATDYMVPAFAIGGMGAYSPLSAVAPKLVRKVYELCVKQQFVEARRGQEDIAALAHCVKMARVAGLKAALCAMGRECGVPRPPASALTAAEQERFTAELRSMPFLAEEPRGW
jgi:4-hydroxy-tetrahydrodipicolinate synthase